MAKYRKKPVVIEAWITKEVAWAAANDWKLLPEPIRQAYEKGGWVFESNYRVHIRTLEGTMIAEPDDYIIMGVKGEFYPCKPDIFEATYEDVSEGEGAERVLPYSYEEEVVANKSLRKQTDEIIQSIKNLPTSRERSLAITKLQEGVMWLGMDLKRLGETNPYSSSKDPNSGAKIEPTADGLKL